MGMFINDASGRGCGWEVGGTESSLIAAKEKGSSSLKTDVTFCVLAEVGCQTPLKASPRPESESCRWRRKNDIGESGQSFAQKVC